MRTRTILVFLLGVYAVVSTVYFVSHSGIFRSRGTGTSQADVNLPVAPPFGGPAASPTSEQDLMARVQIENELRYTDLQSFVCNEQMARYKGHLNGDSPRQIDTVSAHVSFENGVENYSGVQQNSRERESLSSISGAWSEGEFGTLLRQTRTLLNTQPLSLQAVSTSGGEAAVRYSLDVPGTDSPWQLLVGSKKYRVPFRTEVLVAKNTGRILNIKRTSTAMPSDFGISEIQWSVSLKPIALDGKEWLLPTTGEYSILYQKSNRREWNVMSFSDYHHYTASSVMHF